MRHHRSPMPPHEFIPSDVPDWSGAHLYCARTGCEMPKEHKIHTSYVPVNGDRSDAILGEREPDADAA